MPYAYDEDQRDDWAAGAGAVVVLAATRVRSKMAAAIGGLKTLPASPDAVYNTAWWEAELPNLADGFTPIAAEAAESFSSGVGAALADAARDAIAVAVAGQVADLFAGRGDVVYERVSTLLEQGAETGMVPEQLAAELGLTETSESGPLSDSLASSMGTAAATGLSEGAAHGVIDEAGLMGLKTWNCLFVNSRDSHIAADGNTVAVDETFTLEGGQALYPCDPDLPVEEVANCNCWLSYDVVPRPAENSDDTQPDEEAVTEEMAVAQKPKVPNGVVRMTAQSAPWVDRVRRFDVPPAPVAPTPETAPAAPQEDVPLTHTTAVITIEPTPEQKVALAIPGGESADALHVTLVYLGETTAVGDAARLAVTTALAKAGAAHGPMSGKIGGIGWFQDQNAMTLGLIDCDGLAAFRTELVAELIAAGVAVDTTHDFIPHMTLAYSQVDASAAVGTELTFNEVRLRWNDEVLRWNDEVLAFDLIGVPDSPAIPAVPSDEAPPPVPVNQEAAVAQHYEIYVNHPDCAGSADGAVAVVDDTGRLISCHADDVSAQQKADELNSQQVPLTPSDSAPAPAPTPVPQPAPAPSPGAGAAGEAMDVAVDGEGDVVVDTLPTQGEMDPDDMGEMPVDLSGCEDDDLALELARRIARQAVLDSGGDPDDPAQIQVALEEATEELNDGIEEAYEETCEALTGEDDDDELIGDGDDDNHGIDAVDWEDEADPVGNGPYYAGKKGSFSARRKAALAAAQEEAAMPDEGTILTLPPEADPANPQTGPQAEWEGVLVVEGLPSGDRRMIAEGSLTWRDLPIPLMLQTINAAGHEGAVFCGWIHEVFREGEAIIGRGTFLSGEDGDKARAILGDPNGAKRFGVSVDIDSVSAVYTDPAGTELTDDELYSGAFEVVELIVAGRLMGATMTPFPAFQEAQLTLLAPVTDDEPALVAGASKLNDRFAAPVGQVWRATRPMELVPAGTRPMAALVASAAGPDPDAPPKAWFASEVMEAPIPFTVFPDGRCFGLVAEWGTCHIGSSRGRCVEVPQSNDFRTFYTGKKVLTREGDLIPTGPIIMDTVHPNLLREASDAQAFYAKTGCAVADVRLYTNEWGIVAAGAIRPTATPTEVRVLRASDISPDWRPMGGVHRLVSLLAVNTSGFLVEGIAASAGRPQAYAMFGPDGQMGALVAAGAILRDRKASLLDRVAAMESQMAEMSEVMQRLTAPTRFAERRARAAAALDVLGLLEAPCETGNCA